MSVRLGTIGIWTRYRPSGVEDAGETAKLIEHLGYGAWWVGGSPRVADVRPVLESTSTLAAATSILNVWANDAAEAAAAAAAVRAEFPGRFMLGIGVGHREAVSDYRKPLAAMRAFLDDLDASGTPPPRDERCLAALGPKMLELARERAAGTHTYFVPVEHTRAARKRLGPGKLIAAEVACVVDADPVRARAIARQHAKHYLGLRNYVQNLLAIGFTDDDVSNGGSDRLVDAIVPQGSAEEIADVVQAHLDVGADHVCLQPLGSDLPRGAWIALAKALI